MSRVTIVVLCEDRAHSSFINGTLQELGHDAQKVRTRICGGFGAVREALEAELSALRTELSRGRRNHALIAVIDADDETVVARRQWLEATVSEPRRALEPCAYVIPRRHIEGWLLRLCGENVHEVGADGVPLRYDAGADGRRAIRCVRQASRTFAAAARNPGFSDAQMPSIKVGLDEINRVPHHRGT